MAPRSPATTKTKPKRSTNPKDTPAEAPIAGSGPAALDPVTRYYMSEAGYYRALVTLIGERIEKHRKAQPILGFKRPFDAEGLARLIETKEQSIAERSRANAIDLAAKLPIKGPSPLFNPSQSDGGERSSIGVDPDLDERIRDVLATARKKNLRQLLTLHSRLAPKGDSGVLLHVVEFLLAGQYLVPEQVVASGEALLADERSQELASAEVRWSVLEKLVVSLTKLGRYAEADRRWAELAALDVPGKEVGVQLLRADSIWQRDPEAAITALEIAQASGKLREGYVLLHLMLVLQHQGPDAAEALMRGRVKVGPEMVLALYDIAVRRGGTAQGQRFLHHYFSLFELGRPRFLAKPVTDVNAMATDCSDSDPAITDGPLVTVIMTAFNAAATVRAALRSLTTQSYRNLEIIVVDDRSEDDTAAIVTEAAREDGRIRLLRNAGNIGTYLSRNRAMAQAAGEFITFQDSDDWSHPSRIARHVDTMQREPGVVVSKSHWLRMMVDGTVPMRRWSRCFSHVNPSSLFIRRSALGSIGYFDAVRADADFEFARRLELLFAPQAIRTLAQPLSIGFVGDTTLTRAGATAMDDEGYSPVRAKYKAAWLASYPARLTASALPLPALPDAYGYDVPQEMAVDVADAADWFADRGEAAPIAADASGSDEAWEQRPPFWFIISLASAHSSADWPTTVAVFQNTLRAMLRQDDPDFRIVVAGHDAPDIPELADPRVTFIVSDRLPATLPKDFRADKMWKRRLIFQHIRNHGGGYIMPVDADDLVSTKLLSHIRSRPVRDGYIINQGYVLDRTRRILAPVPGAWDVPFERICGSSGIFLLRTDDLPLLNQQDVTGIAAALLGPHANWRLTAEEVGMTIETIEFPASTYVVNTNVNLSFAMQRAGKRTDSLLDNISRAAVPATPEIVHDFALEDLFPQVEAPGEAPEGAGEAPDGATDTMAAA